MGCETVKQAGFVTSDKRLELFESAPWHAMESLISARFRYIYPGKMSCTVALGELDPWGLQRGWSSIICKYPWINLPRYSWTQGLHHSHAKHKKKTVKNPSFMAGHLHKPQVGFALCSLLHVSPNLVRQISSSFPAVRFVSKTWCLNFQKELINKSPISSQKSYGSEVRNLWQHVTSMCERRKHAFWLLSP